MNFTVLFPEPVGPITLIKELVITIVGLRSRKIYATTMSSALSLVMSTGSIPRQGAAKRQNEEEEGRIAERELNDVVK